MKQYDVAIIGAGTAGLSARREVAKKTDNYVVIDDGPLGTTCARTGCMPSKVLIQVANDFHRRLKLEEQGILGGQDLRVDSQAVMVHVRKLRDRFLRAIFHDMESWTDTHLLRKRARFVDEQVLDLGDERLQAKSIIIATGSQPVIPKAWHRVSDFLIDTDGFFSLEKLPESVAVIGLGVIGIELGQALARLGVRVHGVTLDKTIGGLHDPQIQDYALRHFQEEFPITLGAAEALESKDGKLLIHVGGDILTVDRAFAAMGRRPNLDGLGLENLDLPRGERGQLIFDSGSYRIGSTSIYIVGDVNGERPILHEAADEGRIAGYNAVRSDDHCFRRRTKIAITFADPNIAVVGESHKELVERGADFVTGRVSFEGQGRAIVKLQEKGLLHIYAERRGGRLLGAELMAPDGEHLAHLVAWALASEMTVHQALSMPFYHPVTEEGLRTAIRNAAAETEEKMPPLETLRCQDPPVGTWS